MADDAGFPASIKKVRTKDIVLSEKDFSDVSLLLHLQGGNKNIISPHRYN